MSAPLVAISALLGAPKLYALYVVRVALSTLSSLAVSFLRHQVSRKFGDMAGFCFLAATLCQFHLPFYMSRTLPNTFGLVLATVGFACWLKERHEATIRIFVFCIVVFRAEVALIFAPILLQVVAQRRIPLMRAVTTAAVAAAASLALTVAVDSFFWQRLVWPEGEVWYFNVILNKSHEWGVAWFPPQTLSHFLD